MCIRDRSTIGVLIGLMIMGQPFGVVMTGIGVIANAGVSGDTSSGGLSRLDWSVPDGTRLVILELGANDYVTKPIDMEALVALVRQAADRGFTVVLSGRSADLGAGYSGWMFEARRGRHGLVLSPSEAIDGELFGSRVARTALRSRPHAGRGVPFDSTGAQTTVQVPLVERG